MPTPVQLRRGAWKARRQSFQIALENRKFEKTRDRGMLMIFRYRGGATEVVEVTPSRWRYLTGDETATKGIDVKPLREAIDAYRASRRRPVPTGDVTRYASTTLADIRVPKKKRRTQAQRDRDAIVDQLMPGTPR